MQRPALFFSVLREVVETGWNSLNSRNKWLDKMEMFCAAVWSSVHRNWGKQDITFLLLRSLYFFNISEGFNLTAVIFSSAPSFFIPYLPFVFLQWLVDSEGSWEERSRQLLEAKRIQGPRQLINVLLVSHQLKSTFLEARRYSSVVFEYCPARPVKYLNYFSYLLF